MKVKDVVLMANKAPGNFSEQEVVQYFKKANIGHWPSEKSRITLPMDDGVVQVLINNTKVAIEGHTVTPAGRIWILSHFFKTFPPQSLSIIDELSEVAGTQADGRKFAAAVQDRMQGKSSLMKMRHNRVAFLENRVVNSDQSTTLVYETTNLDIDMQERMTVMIPGARPVIVVYLVQNGKVVRFKTRYQGHQIEALEHWEKAALSIEWRAEHYTTTPVSEAMVTKLFSIIENVKSDH